ncbi:FtsK/SpoIIIE domain-containing protein [Lactococcus insecticola]|nr:FtsK/SpoIIIE domain-containing protein [Lactococcus insecticola]
MTLPLEVIILSLPFLGFWFVFFWFTKAYTTPATWILCVVTGLIYAFGVVAVYRQLQKFSFFRVLKYRRMLRFFLEENGYVTEKKSKNKDAKRKLKYVETFFSYKDRAYIVTFGLKGNKHQQKLLKISGDLEITFSLDMIDMIDETGYINYKFMSGLLDNVLKSSEIAGTPKGGLQLMKDVVWDYIGNPHLMIAGGTGGGKTVLMRSMLIGLLKYSVVDILDPKQSDFVPLNEIPVLKDRIFSETLEMGQRLIDVKSFMDQRYGQMRKLSKAKKEKQMEAFHTYGLKPYFIMVDEFPSFMSAVEDELGFKMGRSAEERAPISSMEVMSAIKQIILKGRQAGIFMIIATQNIKSDDIPTTIRDNIMTRVTVGRLSNTSYDILFPNSNKNFKYIKEIDGRRVFGMGYYGVNGESPRQFLSPQMPPAKDFTFWDAYEAMPRLELETEEDVVVSYTKQEFAEKLGIHPRTLGEITKLLVDREFELSKELNDGDLSLFERIVAFKNQTKSTWQEAVVNEVGEKFSVVED